MAKTTAKSSPASGNGKSAPPEAAAETPATPAAAAAPAAPAVAPPGPESQVQPSLRILGQYLKDLSFENPNAPQSLAPQPSQPEISISVNVNARNLTQNDYEVELHLDAKATSAGKVVFAADLLYAGAFRVENFPQNLLHPAILIECPRMLFPFARQILAEATRNGGFPPLMLDPIDFAAMYQQRLQAQAQQPVAKA
jgi:preprotein translocase subunit SecB